MFTFAYSPLDYVGNGVSRDRRLEAAPLIPTTTFRYNYVLRPSEQVRLSAECPKLNEVNLSKLSRVEEDMDWSIFSFLCPCHFDILFDPVYPVWST